MNKIKVLRLHVLSLAMAVEQNRKFFVSIVHYVERFKDLVTSSVSELSLGEIKLLSRKIEDFYEQWRPTGDGFYIPPRETADTDSTVQDINKLVEEFSNLSEAEFRSLIPLPAEEKNLSESRQIERPKCVFIGHGRSKLWARLKIFLQDDLGLATVSYESEPRGGESIVPVLEKMLSQATFSVLILTAEDETVDGLRRARQNVVHEAGLFQGKLGFNKAILLVQDGIEGFTNIAGLQYIEFVGDKIEQSFYELQRVLKREGHV